MPSLDHNPDPFGSIGVFSPIMEPDFEKRYAAELADGVALKKKLSLIWVGVGLDNLFKGTAALHETLARNTIKLLRLFRQ